MHFAISCQVYVQGNIQFLANTKTKAVSILILFPKFLPIAII